MSESTPDDARLRATEAQMRHALGLHDDTSSRLTSKHPTTTTDGALPHRRRFVHDGEVPVTIIRRSHHPDGEPGANQLDAIRRALQSETTAKERAERSLDEAQTTIRDLQTKLAHERLAKDEAMQAAQRIEAHRLTIQQALEEIGVELAAERLARQKVEAALAKALEDFGTAGRVGQPGKAATAHRPTDGGTEIKRVQQGRGRPTKADDQDAEVVEWWIPGWQKRYR